MDGTVLAESPAREAGGLPANVNKACFERYCMRMAANVRQVAHVGTGLSERTCLRECASASMGECVSAGVSECLNANVNERLSARVSECLSASELMQP